MGFKLVKNKHIKRGQHRFLTPDTGVHQVWEFCPESGAPEGGNGFLCVFLQMRLNEENERCLLYLDTFTRKPLIATAERQLLERHIPAILDKGFMMLMDGHRIEDLQRMYSLFSRVNANHSGRP
ncbi:hypothetical protein GOBAR_DD28986 [Gossypium barbadense]|nr:hypothetical protein GOBAR_DD28986 [Gossypium barbadense]